MTIAVGVKYPWGNLNRLLPSGVRIPEAIILASDCRISKKQGGDYIPERDTGTKLFQLGRDSAAVYAGMSKIGEKCIDELRRRLSKQPHPNSINSREITQEVFRTVYNRNLASKGVNKDDSPLCVLIGACNKRGQAELYKCSHISNFTLEPVSGLNVLAWPGTEKSFDNFLNDELNKQVENELSLRKRFPEIPMVSWVPMPIKPEHVAILIVSTLSRIIKTGADKTIGGMVQCAVVTSEGVTFSEISSTPNGTNQGPGWTRATANQDELESVTGISGLFSFYHLSD
jgi:hypothetical protein